MALISAGSHLEAWFCGANPGSTSVVSAPRRLKSTAAVSSIVLRLAAEGVARFPFPPHGRIPNFAGAKMAAARLLDIEPWKSATAIKVNPDSPQRPLRA